MKVKALDSRTLRKILGEARRHTPVANGDQKNSSAGIDPRCVGSLVVDAAARLGHLRNIEPGSFASMPDKNTLGDALKVLFPALAMKGLTRTIANDIITSNDGRRFGEAWDKVENTIDREMRVRAAKRFAGEWPQQLAGAMVCLN